MGDLKIRNMKHLQQLIRFYTLLDGNIDENAAIKLGKTIPNTKRLVFADSPYEHLMGDCVLEGLTSAGTISVTLRRANLPWLLILKKIHGSNSFTVTANGSDLIDGLPSRTLTQFYEYMILASNGLGQINILGAGVEDGPPRHGHEHESGGVDEMDHTLTWMWG